MLLCDTLAGHSCVTLLHDTLVQHSCRTGILVSWLLGQAATNSMLTAPNPSHHEDHTHISRQNPYSTKTNRGSNYMVGCGVVGLHPTSIS